MAAKEDLIREQGETDAAIAALTGKVDAAVQMIVDLKNALAGALANNTGLTAVEVQDLAAKLDAGQAAIAQLGAKLDAATAPDAPPPAG